MSLVSQIQFFNLGHHKDFGFLSLSALNLDGVQTSRAQYSERVNVRMGWRAAEESAQVSGAADATPLPCCWPPWVLL